MFCTPPNLLQKVVSFRHDRSIKLRNHPLSGIGITSALDLLEKELLFRFAKHHAVSEFGHSAERNSEVKLVADTVTEIFSIRALTGENQEESRLPSQHDDLPQLIQHIFALPAGQHFHERNVLVKHKKLRRKFKIRIVFAGFVTLHAFHICTAFVHSRAELGDTLHDQAKIKRAVLPTSLFEQMGFTYLGPVDGHDLKSVCEFLALAKKMKKPVLLHVMTQKGRGYAPSEQYPEKYHGVSKFDRVTGAPLAAKKEDFSAFFGKELCALAEKDNRICAITAAMPSGTGLTRFAEKFPERFFDVGIAEEHAIGMAAGMAAQGLVQVAAIYSTFLQRAYDQIVHDIAIEGLHVVLCVDRAGIVGADGATHNGVLDIAFLRSIPGVKIFCPSDFAELRVMLSRAIYRETGPVAIRYPRGSEGAYRRELSAQPLVCVHEQSGSEVTIVTHGIMVKQAIDAAEILMHEGIRAQVYKVNEIGSGLEQAYAEVKEKLGGWCVVAEDVVPNGSVGEWLAAHRSERTDLLNTGDRFLPHGGVNELYRHCGIDAEGIAAYIMKNRNGKENGVG